MGVSRAYDAVVLAGGGAVRFGGMDKTAELVGEFSLLERVLDAVRDAGFVMVVGGSAPDTEGVAHIVESPPGSGPVHALAAALPAVTAARLVLLAGDLPFVTATVVDQMLAVLDGTDVDAVVSVDDAGRDQYLLAAWDVAALRSAMAASGATNGASLRAIYREVRTGRVVLAGSPPPWWDCDTPQDLAMARSWTERGAESGDARRVDDRRQ